MENFFEEAKELCLNLGLEYGDERLWEIVGKFMRFYNQGIKEGRKEMKKQIFDGIHQIEQDIN